MSLTQLKIYLTLMGNGYAYMHYTIYNISKRSPNKYNDQTQNTSALTNNTIGAINKNFSIIISLIYDSARE